MEGSWEGDTKCINVPPQTLLRQRQRGTEATAWDMGGEGAPAISSPGTPQERALLETARWEGPAPGGKRRARGIRLWRVEEML